MPFIFSGNVAPAFAQSADRFHVQIYKTNIFEASFENPMPITYPDATNQIAFSIDLGDELQVGEILFCMGELLVRHESTGLNGVVVASGIYVGTESTCDASASESVNKFEVTEGNGENLQIDNNLVRQTFIKAGTYLVTTDNHNVARKFVNFRVKVGSHDEENVVRALLCGSGLTILRFTPYELPTPVHGWEITVPHAANSVVTSSITATTESGANTVFRLDLDNPDGNSGTNDAISLQAGDIILALGECEASYTSSSAIRFASKVLLVDSDGSSSHTRRHTAERVFNEKRRPRPQYRGQSRRDHCLRSIGFITLEILKVDGMGAGIRNK